MQVWGWSLAGVTLLVCLCIGLTAGPDLAERTAVGKSEIQTIEKAIARNLESIREPLPGLAQQLAEQKQKNEELRQAKEAAAGKTADVQKKITDLQKQVQAIKAKKDAAAAAAAITAEIEQTKERAAALEQEVVPMRQAVQSLAPRPVKDEDADANFNPIPPLQ